MKITKTQLKQIIKEELSSIMTERVVDMEFEEELVSVISDAKRALTGVPAANRYAKSLHRDLHDLLQRMNRELDFSSRDVKYLYKTLSELVGDLAAQIEEGGFDEDYLNSMKGWLAGLMPLTTKAYLRDR